VLDELRGAAGELPAQPRSSHARPILDAVRRVHEPFWKF